MRKPRIGISTCLLGEKVRYDGQHKLDRFLVSTLGRFVEWVPVCPEVECGLPVPREAMRLEGDAESPRLVTAKTHKDLTDKMSGWIEKKLPQIEKEDLCGFVFKSKSPSSGMERVKLYNPSGGAPRKAGTGLFAAAFMKRFPILPVEEDGRINDPILRENFIERIFILNRWKEFMKDSSSVKELMKFHARHKLMIMAHSPSKLKELGRMAANPGAKPGKEIFEEYIKKLMETLKIHASVRKNVNVLQHIMGYFKKDLSSDEKQELLELIENYHKELVPLIVPVTLLNHYVRKYSQPYLSEQYYLNPHPLELCLRNHV